MDEIPYIHEDWPESSADNGRCHLSFGLKAFFFNSMWHDFGQFVAGKFTEPQEIEKK